MIIEKKYYEKGSLSGIKYLPSEEYSVVSIICKRERPTEDFTLCLQKCLPDFIEVLGCFQKIVTGSSLYYFARTPSFINPNVIVKKRGIWGYNEMYNTENSEKTENIPLKDISGTFYAGIVKVLKSDYLNALESERKNKMSILLFSNENIINSQYVEINSIKMFDEKTRNVKWADAISEICMKENILIKTSGKFDDTEVAIDFFSYNSLFQKVFR